jgi:hypothetical protein
MKTSDVLKAIMEMDADDLREVNKAVRTAFDMVAQKAAVGIRPGTRVSFHTKGGQRIEGVVVKVNRKSIHLDNCSDGRRWRVAPQLITKL